MPNLFLEQGVERARLEGNGFLGAGIAFGKEAQARRFSSLPRWLYPVGAFILHSDQGACCSDEKQIFLRQPKKTNPEKKQPKTERR